MKKLLPLVALLVCAIFTFGQPTINSSIMPIGGETQIYHPVDSASIQHGPGGANQTWTFTSAGIHYNPFSYKFFSPAATGHDSAFSTATVAMEDQAQPGTYHFYKNSSSSYEYLGLSEDLKTVPFSNPLTVWSFPFTYNSSVNDTYSGTADVQGMTLNRSGTYTATGDGHGTLILPTGTFNNVLRVRITHDYTEDYVGVLTWNYEIVEHHWYDGTHKEPLLKMKMMTSYLDTALQSEIKSVVVSDYAAGIAQPRTNVLRMSLYPNPSPGLATIEYTIHEVSNVTISVYNTLGQLVLEENTGKKIAGTHYQKIDFDRFRSGYYFVKVKANDNILTQKLVLD